MPRIVIVGNSGSGKTYLANKLSETLDTLNVHLDQIFWEPGGFNTKRPTQAVEKDISKVKQASNWIVEGVFGELAQQFLDRACHLIWLDMDWDYCQSNLLGRGSESSVGLEEHQADANFRKLLDWASKYWERENLRSYNGHKSLFDRFDGTKFRLSSKREIDRLLNKSQELLGNMR